MKRLLCFITALVCTLMISVPARADINYNLIYNWSFQPPNVQQDLVAKRTNIQVVNTLPWESPDLYETWAYTTMNVTPGTTYVQSIDMYIKTGYESSLTHEVGHVVSNAGHEVYWWCYRPEFIQIWQQERYNCVLLAQGWDDIREYFACAYDCYIRYPQILKQTCPSTYNYITVALRYT